MTRRLWLVTLLDRGSEVTVEVESGSKEGARREARTLHPQGHIIHVERRDGEPARWSDPIYLGDGP